MKLSTKEIKVLAQSVLDKVKEVKGKKEVTAEQKKAIEAYVKLHNTTEEQIRKLRDAKEEAWKNLGKSVKFVNFWVADKEDVKRLISKIDLSVDYPKLTDIENAIILENIFEEKGDIKDFIDKLVKKFSK